MSNWIEACDVSQYQGDIDWSTIPESIVIIKMGGGDSGNYFDNKAAQNYDGAVKAGKAVGGYWFAGGTDPVAEANFFMRCMEPLAENDVYALDWEVAHPNPVVWCLAFMQTVHDKIGVWPLLYINLATLNAYDWSPVLATCGLWLADWAVSPDASIQTSHVYVMQQYADGPDYDRDAWFGTIDEFKAYGYHAPKPMPAPVPVPPTVAMNPAPITAPVMDIQPPLAALKPATVAATTPAAPTNVTVSPPVAPSFSLSQYSKFIVALTGVILSYLAQRYGSNQIVQDALMAATAAGVYFVRNS